MEREYINRKRYDKKNSRNTENKSITSRAKKNVSTKSVTNKTSRDTKSPEQKLKRPNSIKKSNRESIKKRTNSILRIALFIFILSILAICLRLILKDKYSSFLPTISEKEKENTQVINIADYGLTNLYNTKCNNIILSELEQYIYPMLLTIDDDYTINYQVLKSINKVSNSEYLLNIDPKYNISVSFVKSSIEEHMLNNTKYSFKTKNIGSISIEKESTIRIKLKQADPLFIYNLNIPIYIQNSSINKEYNITSSSSSLLTLTRTSNAKISLPKQLTIRNATGLSKAVDMYKSGTIDLFFSSYLNVENLLGKYEYQIKAVNSGKSIFLLGNPSSNLFNKIEIRKAIAYGINKDKIISNAANKNGISIDIPFVYDNQKYKYDIYAAENILLSNGYQKNRGVYEKYESGKRIYLELELIVNKDSGEKIAIANIIKSSLQDIGIKVTISSLTDKELNKRIQDKDYDLVLANITLNENPNIFRLQDNIAVNENIQKKLNGLSNSTTNTVQQELTKLISAISDDVAVIGVYSKPTYIIYRKNITIFDSPGFYKLFRNF